jgi:hypothetical protein
MKFNITKEWLMKILEKCPNDAICVGQPQEDLDIESNPEFQHWSKDDNHHQL